MLSTPTAAASEDPGSRRAGAVTGMVRAEEVDPAAIRHGLGVGPDDPEVISDVELPRARQLVDASPSVRNLCERYHRFHLRLIQRSRGQRLSIAVLVAAVSVGSFLVGRSASLADAVVVVAVEAVAGAAVFALAVLALLWRRDMSRLSRGQGTRLLRALSVDEVVDPHLLATMMGPGHPTTLFMQCYALWCADQEHHRWRG